MSDKLRTVRLYGKLGTKFGRRFDLAVRTPAEAVSALSEMIPGFKQYLIDSKKNGFDFAVFIGKRNISKEGMFDPVGKEDIRIAPVTHGAKKGGIVQIIVGIVLVVVGIIVSGMSFGMAAPLGAAMISAGIGLIAGGVIQLLTPTPKGQGGREGADDNPSKYFTGPLNTQAQGHPVPLLYGRLLVGSAVISAGIYLDDQSPTAPSTTGTKFTTTALTMWVRMNDD